MWTQKKKLKIVKIPNVKCNVMLQILNSEFLKNVRIANCKLRILKKLSELQIVNSEFLKKYQNCEL